MSGEVSSAGHSGLHLPGGEQLGSFVEKQMNRVHMVKSMVDAVGIVNAGFSVADRVLKNGGREIVIDDQPALSHPLRLSTLPSDMLNYAEIFGDRVYDLPERLDGVIDGKPIVDMGGFIGIAASYFASRYPNSGVVAIEPHARNYGMLQANGEPYEGQIDAVFGAVSPTPGAVAASNPHGNPRDYMGNVFSVDPRDGFAHAVDVAETPDAVVPEDILERVGGEDIGILKVDIEGAEKALFLSDGIHALLERTAVLMVEPHDRLVAGSSQAVRAAATLNGLEESSLTPHTMMFVNPQVLV